MLITELELQNFRNYEKQKIEFNNNINIFFIHKLRLHFFIDLFYILGTSGQAYIYLFSILLQSAFS